MTRVYLSLGSNIEPEKHLSAALGELRERFGDIEISPAYRFAAVGFDGPDFVNLAVGLDTDLDPVALNDWLHALEDRNGRRRDSAALFQPHARRRHRAVRRARAQGSGNSGNTPC